MGSGQLGDDKETIDFNEVSHFYNPPGCWDPDQNGSFLLKSSVVPQNNHFDTSHFTVLLENQTITKPAMDHCQPPWKRDCGRLSECDAHPNSGDGRLRSSLDAKRKRKTTEVDSTMEMDDGEEKSHRHSNSRGKDKSTGGENYVHVRAKRGQATNSHSLAERVRRERISERMKMLQELIPGGNKIAGKAMMLDEIINYVQSLQQQVEFLSMKLASVNLEIDMHIEHQCRHEDDDVGSSSWFCF